MSHDYLPLSLRKKLLAKEIKKHNLANILTHWFNVAAWMMLLPTGIAILSSPRLGIVPQVWQEGFRSVFGGTANLITFHYSVGLIWVFILTYNIFVGFHRYFVSFTVQHMWLDKDDIEWLMVKPFQMLGFMKDKKLPPQDVYNAGQKAYSYVVILGTFFIALTGLIMTFSKFIPFEMKWLVQWSLTIHFSAVGAVVAGLLIHVYMGAVFPEERSAFFSMFTGKVNALYARNHHRKWYDRKVQEEEEWEESVIEEGKKLKEGEAAGD